MLAMTAPLLFVSHGAPSAAMEDTPWHAALQAWGRRHRPSAAIVVSAHSSARRFVVSTNPAPATIHDYVGFPAPLYTIQWPASGDPDVAARAVELLVAGGLDAAEDPLMGFDHGVWVPLRAAWPDGGVPVVPLSVPVPSNPEALYAAGEALAVLRDEGIALIATGGLVHNLRQMRMNDEETSVDSWARDFDQWVVDRLRDRGDESLLRYRERAPGARLAVPTEEHFDPLFFVMGARRAGDELVEIYRGFRYGNMALTTVGFE